MEEIKKTIEEETTKLPKEIQAAIATSDWVAITEKIGEKNTLMENEIKGLVVETGLVLADLATKEDYAWHIENSLTLNKNDARKIAEEANQEIFGRISDIIARNMENDLQNRKPDWRETLGFILSGGDYSLLMERSEKRLSREAYKAMLLDREARAKEIRERFLS